VGLWLNLGRVRMQKTWGTMQGLQLALSRSPIPFPFFDAVAGSEDEAIELQYRTNSARAQADARAKMGW
jgi:hypothetical protein